MYLVYSNKRSELSKGITTAVSRGLIPTLPTETLDLINHLSVICNDDDEQDCYSIRLSAIVNSKENTDETIKMVYKSLHSELLHIKTIYGLLDISCSYEENEINVAFTLNDKFSDDLDNCVGALVNELHELDESIPISLEVIRKTEIIDNEEICVTSNYHKALFSESDILTYGMFIVYDTTNTEQDKLILYTKLAHMVSKCLLTTGYLQVKPAFPVDLDLLLSIFKDISCDVVSKNTIEKINNNILIISDK